jgi:hypothetical protein
VGLALRALHGDDGILRYRATCSGFSLRLPQLSPMWLSALSSYPNLVRGWLSFWNGCR